MAKIAERIPQVKVGPGNEAGNEMGPLITGEHRDKVRSYIDAAPAEGAAVVVDGRDGVPEGGFFLNPTLIDNVTPDMACYHDEIFGPVLSVVRVSGYQDGIDTINANPFANGTAIFTRDGGAARQFQFDVQVGMVGINVPVPVPVSYYSFGGWKASLFGDTHMYGPEGINFYTQGQGRHQPLARPRHQHHRPRLPGNAMNGYRRGVADHAAGGAGDRPREAGRDLRVQPRLDVRLAHPVGGAVRHLLPDPGRDPQHRRRADGHQPGDARLDGHGVDVRHAQRDVRQPHGLRDRPRRLGGARHQRQADHAATMGEAIHVIRELANGRSVDYKGSTITLPWATRSRLEVWGAGYGPKALKMIGETCDGFILQLADLSIAEWTIKAVRTAAERRRARSRRDHDLRRRPGLRRSDREPGVHARPVPLVRRHGRQPRRRHRERYGESTAVPQALTDYIKGREGYDYNQHGQAGNTHATFVPDEIVDRFCILGPAEAQLDKLHELQELGVDQFAIYLQHDGKDHTLDQYGEHVIPALREQALARS